MGYVQGMCDLLAPLMVILDDGEKPYGRLTPDTDGSPPVRKNFIIRAEV